LSFGCAELRFGSIRGSLALIVCRSRYCTGAAQDAVAGFILRCLLRPRSRGSDRLLLCMRCKLQIDGVDAHERLAAFDGLPGIHKPLQHLAGDAKPQVALHPGGYGSRERT